jgi:hypothetical protein
MFAVSLTVARWWRVVSLVLIGRYLRLFLILGPVLLRQTVWQCAVFEPIFVLLCGGRSTITCHSFLFNKD